MLNEMFYEDNNDHSISSEDEDTLVRSCSNLSVSFGYHCNSYQSFPLENDEHETSPQMRFENNAMTKSRNGSFTCLSGAAISANFTLANTNICNGLIGEEILPELDSPNSFRKIVSSPSMSRLDLLSTSQGSPASPESSIFEISKNLWRSSAPTSVSSNFVTGNEVKMAGGAAGEDRVQAVCSEKNGWLICGIYDGFNGGATLAALSFPLRSTLQVLFLNQSNLKSSRREKNRRTNRRRPSDPAAPSAGARAGRSGDGFGCRPLPCSSSLGSIFASAVSGELSSVAYGGMPVSSPRRSAALVSWLGAEHAILIRSVLPPRWRRGGIGRSMATFFYKCLRILLVWVPLLLLAGLGGEGRSSGACGGGYSAATLAVIWACRWSGRTRRDLELHGGVPPRRVSTAAGSISACVVLVFLLAMWCGSSSSWPVVAALSRLLGRDRLWLGPVACGSPRVSSRRQEGRC